MEKLDPWKEIFDKLGIKKMTDRCISAESDDVLFSKFDKCSISGFEMLDGTLTENKRYHRDISNNFNIIYEFLKKFGYIIDNEYYNSKRYNFLSANYIFISKGLPRIDIDFNIYHNNLYKISLEYNSSSSFYDIKDHKSDIYDTLRHYARKNNNIMLLRELKLSKIIN